LCPRGSYVAFVLSAHGPSILAFSPRWSAVAFVMNLKVTKALGLQIPDKLLALADEVIE
jgi:hypothetical protein